MIHTSILGALLWLTSSMALHLWQPHGQATEETKQETLAGAWKLASGTTPFADIPAGATAIALMQDGYFSVAYFSTAAPQFIGTYGGTYTAAAGKITQHFMYNTFDSAAVGTAQTLAYTLQAGQLQTAGTQKGTNWQQTWELVATPDKSPSPLAGTWQITARADAEGTLHPMQRGPRKTLKILTGGRFQWIAFNTETKQFSGTGGGTYTTTNGKYTEHIDFFSRDPSRVGATLAFDYAVEDGKWVHSGHSSAGKPIKEVWERGQPSH
ncbi:membrane or secreted protein [Pontibacter sp. E15-1]|uniref:membrane or secreted protein n=1 Tax=Pontibacter sp. E15-1 TaxID=2919918 RepID=UPI001F4FDC33|nr:membrane or secreted protein [Pontibacter sp. E15-1]MCJ8164097.1 membrane or secreted protein [Pontibacter sp. E15-1]